MEIESTITHLTKDTNSSIKQNPDRRTSSVMQVLEVKEQNNKTYLALSDGTYYLMYVLLPKIKDQVLNDVQKLSIVNANVVYSSKQNLQVCFKIDVIYKIVKLKIGMPIELKDPSEQNPQGTQLIPQTVIFENSKNNF